MAGTNDLLHWPRPVPWSVRTCWRSSASTDGLSSSTFAVHGNAPSQALAAQFCADAHKLLNSGGFAAMPPPRAYAAPSILLHCTLGAAAIAGFAGMAGWLAGPAGRWAIRAAPSLPGKIRGRDCPAGQHSVQMPARILPVRGRYDRRPPVATLPLRRLMSGCVPAPR